MKHKYTTIIVALIGFSALFMGGCMKPPEIPIIEEIQSNETAFVVPLEAANKTNQGKFMSVDYLNEAKVATKRITIPVRWRKTGRSMFGLTDTKGEWIPTMLVIRVNRHPVTREWTDPNGGTTQGVDDAIKVESRDSIGFAIGTNLTCMITEDDAATFLYYYPGKALAQIVDTNVRGFVQVQASDEFGSRNLEACKQDKAEIFKKIFVSTKEHFKQFGITITNLGFTEGLTYEDREIQQAINDAYVAEMSIQRERQKVLAQAEINKRQLSIAQNERARAEEFALAKEAQTALVELEIERMRAQAMVNLSEKWDGQSMPYFIGGGGNSPFLFQAPNKN